VTNFFFGIFSLTLIFGPSFGPSLYAVDSEENKLIARGEHRIEVQNYGHRDPEIPIWIMQSNYYNAHHEQYVIRIEDLNQTLNKEINQDINKEYNEWFNAEYNERRAAEQLYERQAEDYQEQEPSQ
jgi:hypothetical protein